MATAAHQGMRTPALPQWQNAAVEARRSCGPRRLKVLFCCPDVSSSGAEKAPLWYTEASEFF